MQHHLYIAEMYLCASTVAVGINHVARPVSKYAGNCLMKPCPHNTKQMVSRQYSMELICVGLVPYSALMPLSKVEVAVPQKLAHPVYTDMHVNKD